MINKVFPDPKEAIADIQDGATVMIGGWGRTGVPLNLRDALVEQGTRNLTVIYLSPSQFLPLLTNKRVKKAIGIWATMADPRMPNPFEEQCKAGELEIELNPLGVFNDRIWAGGSGISAIYTPYGVGTSYDQGKEKRVIDGKECILVSALRAEFALIKAYRGDRMGNLVYRRGARVTNPVMVRAADVTIAEVEELVDVGDLDPDEIMTPGIFVDRVVPAPRREEWVHWYHKSGRERCEA